MFKWGYLPWINKGLAAIAVFFLTLYFLLFSFQKEPESYLIGQRPATGAKITKFEDMELNPKDFEKSFGLSQPPLPIEIPDLGAKLSYWGTHVRPDFSSKEKAGSFSWKGGGEGFLLIEGKKNYLVPTGDENYPYAVRAEKGDSPLFLEVTLNENSAELFLSLDQGEKGVLSKSSFKIDKNQGIRAMGPQGMLGDLKVDGSLLIRQKARWFGKDLFIETHGGEEYASLSGKERIVFQKEDQVFPFYLDEKGYLYWYDGFWSQKENLPENVNPLTLPLLELSKKDERILRFTLWGPEGKYAFPMTLVRMPAPWIPLNYINQFKFLGIRSKQAWNFEISGERRTLRPSEWLLRQEDKWILLETESQIDDYVDGRLVGELIVLSRMGRKEGKQVIFGHIFNPQRSEKVDFELPYDSSEAILPSDEETQIKNEKPLDKPLQNEPPEEKERSVPKRVRRDKPE